MESSSCIKKIVRERKKKDNFIDKLTEKYK